MTEAFDLIASDRRWAERYARVSFSTPEPGRLQRIAVNLVFGVVGFVFGIAVCAYFTVL